MSLKLIKLNFLYPGMARILEPWKGIFSMAGLVKKGPAKKKKKKGRDDQKSLLPGGYRGDRAKTA